MKVLREGRVAAKDWIQVYKCDGCKALLQVEFSDVEIKEKNYCTITCPLCQSKTQVYPPRNLVVGVIARRRVEI